MAEVDVSVHEFFRLFVDPSRLRLAGPLLDGPLSVAELAARTGLDARSIGKHLARIDEAGLLCVKEEEGERRYALDAARLRALAASVLHDPPAAAPRDEREKTLRTFLPDGKLKQLPAQQRKQLYILAEIAGRFLPGATYDEAEVNALLREITPDHFGTLRRLLVDFGFLKRDNMVGGAVYTRGLSIRTVLAAHGIAGGGEGEADVTVVDTDPVSR